MRLLRLLLLCLLLFWARGGLGVVAPKAELIFETLSACRPPTIDNPFANSNVYADDARLAACPANMSAVSAKYRHNLLVDSKDVFAKRTGFMHFATNPSTTFPNDVRPERMYPLLRGCKNDNHDCTTAPNQYFR